MGSDSWKRFWYSLPLASKIAGLASLLVLGVTGALTLITIQRDEASFQWELEQDATLLLETLALTIEDPLYRLQVDELAEVGRVVSRNAEVTDFRVYDRDGALLIDSAQPEPIIAGQPDAFGLRLLEQGGGLLEWRDDRLIAGRAVMLGNQTIGAVEIGLSTQDLNQRIAALTGRSLTLAAVALASGIGLAALLAGQITRPLSHLANVAALMAAGDLSRRAELDHGDEVGRMSKAFNQMAEAVQRREAELRNLTMNLEYKVAQRTVELREQNSALIAANEALHIARQEAEEATRLKSQFLATMSHELRTPLNAIIGFSQVLLEGIAGPMSDKQLERVDRIFKNAEVLLNMINDLLDLAKIEAGRTELMAMPFTVSDWLRELTQGLEGLAQEKGLQFTVRLDQSLPHQMVGDPVRLRQIATNLLSNAIKFTDQGGVSIYVLREGEDRWSIEVTDTGIGIPQESLRIIFDEFRQVDQSMQRRHGGTGLGLAITRKLVRMMGGQIDVSSAIGEGSIFTVHLPLVVEKVTQA